MCCLLKDLNANLAALTAEFEKATAEKIKCQQEADATNRVITLANRYRANAGSRRAGTICCSLALLGDNDTVVMETSKTPKLKNPKNELGQKWGGGCSRRAVHCG